MSYVPERHPEILTKIAMLETIRGRLKEFVREHSSEKCSMFSPLLDCNCLQCFIDILYWDALPEAAKID